DADSLFGGRQGEVQGLPEDYRIRLTHIGVDRRTKNFGFEKEGGGIRPVQRGRGDDATSLVVAAGIDPGERTWPRDARSSHIAVFVVRPSVHGYRGGVRFPKSVRRTWSLAIAGHVSLVHHLKGPHRTADVQIASGIHRVANAD